jgi:hypothetical protein
MLRRDFHGSRPLQGRLPSLCSARFSILTNGKSEPMRAETESLVDEIKQAITLLRRHL